MRRVSVNSLIHRHVSVSCTNLCILQYRLQYYCIFPQSSNDLLKIFHASFLQFFSSQLTREGLFLIVTSPARQIITYFVYWPILSVPYLALWQFITHLFVWIFLQLQRNREARLICTTPFVYDSFLYVKVPSWMSKTRTATLPSMSLSDTTRCHNYDSYRICKMSAR